jgi:hypothetical protein
MIASTANSKPRLPVRWPFRVGALGILVAGVVATVAVPWLIWFHPTTGLPLSVLVELPAMLMTVRFAYHAAVHGRSPPTLSWPFASDRVAFSYIVVLAYAIHSR